MRSWFFSIQFYIVLNKKILMTTVFRKLFSKTFFWQNKRETTIKLDVSHVSRNTLHLFVAYVTPVKESINKQTVPHFINEISTALIVSYRMYNPK